MTALKKPRRQGDFPQSFARTATLSVALCALLLTGCTVGGPQGNGDLAGRQSKATQPPDVATLTVVTLAERERATGDLSSAISLYRRAINLDPFLTKAYVGLGETLLAAGSANEAVETFREAMAQWPNDPAILRGLGMALLTVNQPVAAAEVLDRATKIEPSARTYGALGVAQNLLGNPDAADQAFRQGLVLAPDDLDLLNNFGLSLALRGDYDAAIRTLRRAASDSKATARHRLNLAMVLGLAGRNDDAEQIARIDLDERSVRSNIAYYAILRGLSPEARAAAILRPGSPLPPSMNTAGLCNGTPCAKPVVADDQGKTAVAANVEATPLAPKPAAQPTVKSENAVAKPAKDAKPQPSGAKKADVATPAPKADAAAPKAAPPAEPNPAPSVEPPTKAEAPQQEPAWDAPKSLTTIDPTPKADANTDSKESKAPDTTQSEAAPAPTVASEAPKPETDSSKAPTLAQEATPPAPPSEAMPAQAPQVAEAKGDDNAPKVEQPSVAPAPAPATAAQPEHVTKALAAIGAGSPGKHAAWVQIASFRSEQNAQNAWRNMANGNKDLVFDRLFSVRRVDLPEKGTFYVLRMGPFETVERAHDLCSALRDRKIECFVAH